MKKHLLVYCFALFFVPAVQAQKNTYHVQVINHGNLVNPASIIQLLKDSKGFLWLLSPTKVQRYDGKNFVAFSFTEHCFNISEDDKGSIWLASGHAIYCYRNDYQGFQKIVASPGDGVQYLAMVAGPGKKIYLLTKKNILEWKPEAMKLEEIPGIQVDYFSSFPFLKSSGNCLFYQKNKTVLARYNVASKATVEIPVRDGDYLFPVNEDSVWVREGIGRSALVSFTAKTVTPVTGIQFNEKVNGNYFLISGCSNNFSFVSFRDNGYYTYLAAANKFRKVNLLSDGLPLSPLQPISCVYQEENGIIWFANAEGLAHFNPGNDNIGLVRCNESAGETWNNTVRNFAEDSSGNIWFATANGFCRLDRRSGSVKTWLPGLESVNYLNFPSIRSIGYSNGKIIVGQSEKGYWIFDPATNTFKRPLFDNELIQKQFEGSFNTNMLQLRNGNFLIFCRQLWLMNKDDFRVSPIILPGIEPIPRAGIEDSQGRIWLAGGGGIIALDKNFNVVYSLTDEKGGKLYNAIVQVDSTTFWTASKSLFEVKLLANGSLQTSAIFPELNDVHFSHLFRDSLQHIWMFCDKGIYRFIPEAKILEKFDWADNAQPYNISISNSFRSRDGTLYAGSANGINYFVPEKVPFLHDSLQVLLMNVSVNQDDSTYLLKGNLPKLNYSQNSLVFNFNAPYVYNGDKIQYRCMLEGADKNWAFLGNNNTIRYTSIEPGHYTFHVSASINGQDWYQPLSALSFTITPPLWKTWWFSTLAIALLITIATVWIKRRTDAMRNRAEIKQRMTELEIIAIRAQMNPHFIFNVMNSIQQFTLKNDTDNANLYISKFSALLRNILNSSQQVSTTLENEINQLHLYLDIEKLRMGDNFQYSINVDESIETDAIHIPSMLIQPFVENALRHGLALKEGSKRLTIDFTCNNENELAVLITDNGIGREKAREIKLQQEKLLPHQSRGIKLVKERLHLLNAGNGRKLIEITDLADEAGNRTGTSVYLLLPGVIG